jgi:hypothetical protein
MVALGWPSRRPTLLALAAIGGALVVLGGIQLVGKGPSSSPTPSSSAGASSSLAATSSPSSASPSLAASVLPSEVPPSASQFVRPSPRPNAETGTDLAWQRVATFDSAKNVSVSDVAAGPGGYVAVGVLIDGLVTELGFEGTALPAIWHSADGTTWTEGDASAFGDHQPFAIASDGSRYVVALFDGDRTLLFRSVDGRAWLPIASQPITSDARAWDIAAAPDFGFIVLGALDVGLNLSIWSSPDGAMWTKQLDVLDGSEPIRLAVGPDEAVVFGYGPSQPDGSIAPALWRSTTGADWQRNDPPSAGHGGLEVAAPTSFGWVAAGYVDGAGIAVWHSADARTWTALPQQAELRTDYEGDTGGTSVAFAFAGSEYLFGYASCCAGPPQRTYVSADGEHWGRVARASAIFPVHFGTVIVEGNRVVAIGNTLGDGGMGGTGGIWIGRVP